MTTKVGICRDRRNKARPWAVRWYGEYDPSTGRQRRYQAMMAAAQNGTDAKLTYGQENATSEG